MPDISGAGTFTEDTPGYEGLAATDKERAITFAGSSVGTSCALQYIDDMGVARTPEDGAVTTLPRSFTIRMDRALQIVTTGSADLNVTITRVIGN